MWPLIGAAIAAAAAKKIYDAFNDDDNSSSSDDSSYRREKALRQERESHNQKIKQEITTYVDGEVSKIEDSIRAIEEQYDTQLEWEWEREDGWSFGQSLGDWVANQAATGEFYMFPSLSELDTPLLEEENERLEAEIKRLEEFKNAIQ